VPFDFAACYSAGEARHRHYSGRRHWRALSLLAPSLNLPAHYEDLLLGPPAYPFSVVPDHPIDRTDFFAIMRDTYTNTEFDLATQPAAGPFGAFEMKWLAMTRTPIIVGFVPSLSWQITVAFQR
jgi:dipeptidase